MNSDASPTVRSLQADMEAALQKLEAIADELKQMADQYTALIQAKSGGPRNA